MVYDLLKSDSQIKLNILVTSVFIRHRDKSVKDFEDFVREIKRPQHLSRTYKMNTS